MSKYPGVDDNADFDTSDDVTGVSIDAQLALSSAVGKLNDSITKARQDLNNAKAAREAAVELVAVIGKVVDSLLPIITKVAVNLDGPAAAGQQGCDVADVTCLADAFRDGGKAGVVKALALRFMQ